VNHIAPKLFTAFGGQKVVKKEGFIFLIRCARSITFLDRTVAARRPEKPAGSTTGIIPGDRGKVGGSWCHPPLRRGQPRLAGRYHQLLWPESCPVSSSTNQELSGEARLETVHEPSQVRGRFRPAHRHSYPEGYGCYCADQNAVAFSGGPTPPKGPALTSGARKGKAAAGSERAWQSPSTSSTGAARKNASPHCKSERNLRVKRSDP